MNFFFLMSCTLTVIICSDIRFDILRKKRVVGNFEQTFVKDQKRSDLLFDESKSNRVNDTVPLFKFLNSEFYGEILIGDPGQKFKVIFDVASVHSWVPSIHCSPFQFPACALKSKYDSRKSVTYRPDDRNLTIVTDKGKIRGKYSMDKFHVGHSNIINQTFIEADEMSNLELLNVGFDGVIGLATAFKVEDNCIPFIVNLLDQRLVKQPIFSFFFNRDETTYKGGSLFLGASDKKHYDGHFVYTSVTDTRFWEFRIIAIILNDTSPITKKVLILCEKGCNAYPNTAEVLIYGPKEDIDKINKFISANYVPYLGRYEVSCNLKHKLPHITFMIGGHNFTLTGNDYVEEINIGAIKICLSAFSTRRYNEKFSDWALGISFLGKVYSQFDIEKRQIGFATLNL